MKTNLTFWPDENAAAGITSLPAACVARPWCDPSKYLDVIGADFGKGEMHLYWCSSGKKRKVPSEQAAWVLPRLGRGNLVLMEDSHGGVARTERSLAQPFTQSGLIELYADMKRNGVTLMLFPHSHSGPRAREWAAFHFPEIVDGVKGDANDAASIALFVKHCNDVSLAKPRRSFARCARRQYGKAVIDGANIVLNAERTYKYAGKMFPLIVSLGIAIKKKSRLKLKAAVSVAALLATEIDGKPVMYARNGSVPGAWFWWRYVARMTPFHHRGGIARSNLMRHTFRPFMLAHGERRNVFLGKGSTVVKFGRHNQQQRVARAAAMKAFRSAVLDAYRAGVVIAADRGFELYDPLSAKREATDGR